jgi:hypothetical protein
MCQILALSGIAIRDTIVLWTFGPLSIACFFWAILCAAKPRLEVEPVNRPPSGPFLKSIVEIRNKGLVPAHAFAAQVSAFEATTATRRIATIGPNSVGTQELAPGESVSLELMPSCDLGGGVPLVSCSYVLALTYTARTVFGENIACRIAWRIVLENSETPQWTFKKVDSCAASSESCTRRA